MNASPHHFHLLACLFVGIALCVEARGQEGEGRGQEGEGRAQEGEGRAQEGEGRAPTHWKAELPGGVFLVPHNSITSISKSSYVVDGVMRVEEVSVGTLGSVQGRFYFVEPLQARSPAGVGQSALDLVEEKAREVRQRLAGETFDSEVVKNYPTTTHAHTVEFFVDSPEILQQLYDNLEESYLRRRSRTFRP